MRTDHGVGMDVTIQDQTDHILIQLAESRLDAAIAGEFKDKVRPHIAEAGPDLVLDLATVEFLDSSGLGAVIALKKALPDGKRMFLRGLTPNVERVFKLTRMDQVFEFQKNDMDGAS